MKLLLVEDDAELAGIMRTYLEGEGFEVQAVAHYEAGLSAGREGKPDAILLDVMLPGGDGFSLCRELRRFFFGPILMVTARDSSFDEVQGLNAGADDFLTKPVVPDVLVARLRAHLRRAAGRLQRDDIRVGALKMHRGGRTATFHDVDLNLSTAEFDALSFLAENAGKTVSRDELSLALRGTPHNGVDRSIDLRISRVRRRLAEVRPEEVVIKTVFGTGYVFVRDKDS